jgi:hypothetical protein
VSPRPPDAVPLGRELDALRGTVARLRDDHDALADRVDDLRVADLAGAITDLGERLGAVEGRLTELGFELQVLHGRTGWLEHHVRAAAGAPTIDLDRPDRDTAGLVQAVRRGRSAGSQLLSEAERSALATVVAHRRDDEARRAALEHQALRHSRVLADGPSTEAAEAFRRAYDELRRLGDDLAGDRDEHDEARAALARDDASRPDLDPLVVAGTEADVRLRARCRARIEEALAERSALPAWFTAALGYEPPAGDPGPGSAPAGPEPAGPDDAGPEPAGGDRWLDVATDVLVYRLVNDVRDPLAALGTAPLADPATAAERDALARRLTALRR